MRDSGFVEWLESVEKWDDAEHLARMAWEYQQSDLDFFKKALEQAVEVSALDARSESGTALGLVIEPNYRCLGVVRSYYRWVIQEDVPELVKYLRRGKQ